MTTCRHSFPDPHPAPLTQIGDCRHCGTSYQDARAAMTAADELRAAAAKLRALAETAQHDLETADYWKPYTSNAWAHGFINGFGGPSSDYAAVLPPVVGLALADWLEHEAAGHEAVKGLGDVTTELINVQLEQVGYGAQITHSTLPQALAVARAILGTQEQP